MALVSPGVQVTVTDQSQYVPSAVGTVPYVLLVTAQDKPSGSGPGLASGTLKVNANRVYLLTSQRDLLEKFGTPTFYTDGDEINEYGLLAAYSALGLTNRLYVQRADIDLNSLKGSLTRPTGNLNANAYWLDLANCSYGLTVWDLQNQTFTYKKPITITDVNQLTPISAGVESYSHIGSPLNSIGLPGDFAVVAVKDYPQPPTGNIGVPQYAQNVIWQKVNPILNGTTFGTANYVPYYLPGMLNTWQAIGSFDWQWTVAPTIVGDWVNNVSPSPFLGNFYSIFFNDVEYPNIDGGGGLIDQFLYWQNAILNNGAKDRGIYCTFQVKPGDPTKARFLIYANGYSNTTVTVGGKKYYVLKFKTSASDANTLAGLGMRAGTYLVPQFEASPNYQQPAWEPAKTPAGCVQNAPTGSIWQVTNDINFNGIQGCHTEMKFYDTTTKTFLPAKTSSWYLNDAQAIAALDPTGGANIPVGTVYTQASTIDWVYNENVISYLPDVYARTKISSSTILYRYATGPTIIKGGTATGPFVQSFSNVTISLSNVPMWMQASEPGSSTFVGSSQYKGIYRVPAPVFCPGTTLAAFVQGINDAAVPNVYAYIENGKAVISHLTGGTIEFTQAPSDLNFCNENLFKAGFNVSLPGVRPLGNRPNVTLSVVPIGTTTPLFCVMSNWASYPQFDYNFIQGTVSPPVNNTLWYWNDPTQADIMIQNNGAWRGYRNVTNSVRGENLSLTNATGPIFSTTAPTTQTNSSGSQLVPGDLWIDTSDLENYPKIYRWTLGSFSSSWVLINNTDQQSSNGILFADARWATNGTTDPVSDPIPPIANLLTSNYLDLDAPNPALYPQGTLLFNTRRSGYNVKSYQVNYFNQQSFPNQSLPQQTATWLTVSGNKNNGSPYMGRQAQRVLIVRALKSTIDTTDDLRDEQKQFTLISCPQYPELAINMVALNNERGDTAFSIIDTPLRLPPSEIVDWATNNNGLGTPTADGLAISDAYSASWYPSCQSLNLDGKTVVQPPSHMMIRTIINNDEQSYPWFAPAGTQRGKVDNALQLGYLNSQTSQFIPLSVNQGIRDVLYTNSVNPLTFIPGSGIVNFGNKTSTSLATAMDRINVARLVAFLRGRLKLIADQYLFEPNDQITRNSITNAIEGLMIDLVAKRALYDYLVVCDLSNNTPDRIDRNELWVDIAVEPVKAVEFIYIPVRIKNTGAIAAGA